MGVSRGECVGPARAAAQVIAPEALPEDRHQHPDKGEVPGSSPARPDRRNSWVTATAALLAARSSGEEKSRPVQRESTATWPHDRGLGGTSRDKRPAGDLGRAGETWQ